MCGVRSHEVRGLITLIQDADVDGVQSWLQTNIPSKHEVCLVNDHHKKDTDVSRNVGNYFQNQHIIKNAHTTQRKQF